MKKIGKIGLANIKARKRIANISRDLNIDSCELCSSKFCIAPAHKHNREYYKGDWRKLSDYDQWICLCQKCHQIMDDKSKTSEENVLLIFKKLRG